MRKLQIDAPLMQQIEFFRTTKNCRGGFGRALNDKLGSLTELMNYSKSPASEFYTEILPFRNENVFCIVS